LRSSFNPYTILSKSKKPEIQDWLKKAETMQADEIRALKLKPDLTKAMLYVCEQNQRAVTDAQAESLADLMQQMHKQQDNILQIWQYNGGTEFVRQTMTTSVDVASGSYFGVRDNKAFVNNCWCPLILNANLLSNSAYIEDGDPTRLNILNKQRRNKAYGV